MAVLSPLKKVSKQTIVQRHAMGVQQVPIPTIWGRWPDQTTLMVDMHWLTQLHSKRIWDLMVRVSMLEGATASSPRVCKRLSRQQLARWLIRPMEITLWCLKSSRVPCDRIDRIRKICSQWIPRVIMLKSSSPCKCSHSSRCRRCKMSQPIVRYQVRQELFRKTTIKSWDKQLRFHLENSWRNNCLKWSVSSDNKNRLQIQQTRMLEHTKAIQTIHIFRRNLRSESSKETSEYYYCP